MASVWINTVINGEQFMLTNFFLPPSSPVIMVTALQIVIGIMQSGPQEEYTGCVAMFMNVSTDNASDPVSGS